MNLISDVEKLWSAVAWRDHQDDAECYCYFIISRQLSLTLSAPLSEQLNVYRKTLIFLTASVNIGFFIQILNI